MRSRVARPAPPFTAIAWTHYDAFNDHDSARGASVVADDLEWVDVPLGATYRGPDGYHAFLDAWSAAFPDAEIEITRQVATADGVVTEFVSRGTQTGPLRTTLGAIPPTGRRLELACCEVMRIKDGRIHQARLYYDAATLLRQLGHLP